MTELLLRLFVKDYRNTESTQVRSAVGTMAGFVGMGCNVLLFLAKLAIGLLSGREQQIISMRFGLGGYPEHTQKQVADRLGISQSYISRLEKRIIQRIRTDIQKLI